MEATHNVAVIGCGYWGPNLTRNFRSIPGCTVKKVCDLDQQKMQHVKQLYPEVETTTDPNSILRDDSIDAVAVATPVSTHHSLGMLCLRAGKHTFIEKPLARSAAECEELIELAHKKSLTLMVDHTFVYSPSVRKIRETVASGALGQIMYVSSRRLNLGLFQKDINVAWDLAPHDISILLYALDEYPLAVNCQGVAHLSPGIEDVANITLRFGNGGFGIIQNSWIDPRKVREVTVVGSQRMLLYDDTEPFEKIRIYDKRVESPPHYDTYAEFHFSYHYGDMSAPYLKQAEPLRVECEHFLDCIRTGRQPDSSGEQGLAVVRVLEAATRSLRMGGAQVLLSGGPGAEAPAGANGSQKAAKRHPAAEALPKGRYA